MFELLISKTAEEHDEALFSCSSSTGDTLLYWIYKQKLDPNISEKIKNHSERTELLNATINCARLYSDDEAISYFTALLNEL